MSLEIADAPKVDVQPKNDRGVRVRRATGDDRETVLELLAEYLPGADVAFRHAWLYEDNPHGASVTMVAFEDASGEPMGLTSLFPRRVLVGGKVRIGSIGGDGFVRPKFRRRGVATALHKACCDAMSPGDVGFMFGAPVINNLKALLRAGSRVVCDLQRFSRPAIAQRAVTTLWKTAPRLERITPEHTAKLDALWEEAKEDRLVMPVRDAAHWLWRFGRTPEHVQRGFLVMDGDEPIAAAAIELMDGVAGIVDLLAPRGHLGRALWSTALACGQRTVTMLTNQGSPLVTPLLACGFFPRETKGFQVLAPENDPDEATLFDKKRWYYTWGDSDVDRVLVPADGDAHEIR